ncbi:MAG: class I SAM-dependent methyltransferase [Oscillatoria princeps RMCB-10]|nr:class I SAM-dependent methyltransferase [Oscillatoria princeps RMCB-10]
MNVKSFLRSWLCLGLDILGIAVTPLVALVSKIQARYGYQELPISYKIWDFFGVSPVRHHYYQPIFKVSELPEKIWTEEDPLYGIDLKIEGQLNLLKQFEYNSELELFSVKKQNSSLDFYYDNLSFESGDAETLYNVIRYFKPGRVLEIGSGFSTRIAKYALDKNRAQGKACEHICIEPFENPWLEELGAGKVIREKVETLPLSTFEILQKNDILFIDSSHVLRTGGDVLYEYLRILPTLNSGVIVHIHDIFLPFEYIREWIVNKRRFWTEQYLLQAFLAFNSEFEVLLALNYLAHHYKEELAAKCPIFAKQENRVPGSFWIRRK